MIRLHRLNGVEVIVNAELIEWIDAHGTETVLHLATGNKMIVTEPDALVVQKILDYKKTVFSNAHFLPEFLRGDKERNTPCHSPS